MLVFNAKKGVRLLSMVVSKGLDTKEVKKQLDKMSKPTYNDWDFKGWYRYSYGGESHFEPYEYGTLKEQEQRKLDNKGQNQLEEDILLHAYLEPKNSKKANYSEDQTRKNILRQDVPHINMMNSLDGTVRDLGGYLKSSFFVTADVDWNKAIKEGHAKYPGDFSKHRQEKHKPGEYVPGDENKISTKVLKPTIIPGIIKKLPEHAQLKDANGRNLEGNEYSERSKNVFENSYTFTLKEGLTFENGEPIDASTVEYTLKQYIDPKQKNARSENVFKNDYMDLKDAKGYYEGQITDFNQVTGFKKVENDPYSFTLTYNIKKALYNAMGGLDLITLVPPKYYEESFENKAERKNNIYGTPKKPIQSYGPYVIKEWSPNQKYFFNKNYNYWNKNKHHDKAISWTIVGQKDIKHSMFKDGKVNTLSLDSNYYPSYSKDPTYKEFPVDSKTTLSINVLDRKDEFKNTKTTAAASILKDLDFRKALFYAIDRQDFVNQVDILSNPSFSFVPDVACVYPDEPFEVPYNSSANHKENQKILTDKMDTYGFDPAKAKTFFDLAYDKWKVNNQKDPKLEMEFIYSNTIEETEKKRVI
ncbi:ABC transporter substrate-binding protein [Vaccinium witches'-broom phytoplasma]|uniref:ABC transporter substrate-binding protein n=1 Tax=Vaccinium witches'-broom phytoplasma TaxID=85642 RepID=UPI0004B2D78A|nr:ABC transporter substrate-binding protein [Vaccinium witches'-broom phytoplasma]